MRHSGVRGDEWNTASEPGDLGWDDSLYRTDHTAPHVPQQASPVDGGGGYGPDASGTPESRYEADSGGSGHNDGGRRRRGGGDGGNGGGRAAARRRKKPKRRILRWVAIVTSIAILGTAGGAWAYYQHLNNNLAKDTLNLGSSKAKKTKANAAGQTPLNILLLGSDTRTGSSNGKLGGGAATAVGARADVEMLLHLSADRSNMTVVSVPRDTRVTIPKCTSSSGTVYPQSSDIINASLGHGGPGCTVATWEKLTGISIDHFMMVDFSGVVKLADAVGGVPVCVKANVQDPDSHLKLTKGTHTIKGQQALEWLRTRHAFEDGSDIGRTHAQHMYLNSMIRQLKAGTKLTDVGQLNSLAEAATHALTVDNGLGLSSLISLAGELNKVPTKRITMTTMPSAADPQDPKAHVVPTSAATQLFTMIRNDQPVDGKTTKKTTTASASASAGPSAAPKADISVAVQNGTGNSTTAAVSGRATTVVNKLTGLGYTKAAVDSTTASSAGTTITYPSAEGNQGKANAEAVAKSLSLPTSAVKKSTKVTQLTLVIGSDWTTGSTYPKSSKSDTKAVLDQSAALNASNTSACMSVYAPYTF
ncbi:LCP family protein [Actinacidiphila soli]|uniref:LCP family protein n=1 Tax=Actinacidiphila soli TaxID=2487275 RepID=UPI000FCC6BC9